MFLDLGPWCSRQRTKKKSAADTVNSKSMKTKLLRLRDLEARHLGYVCDQKTGGASALAAQSILASLPISISNID